MTHTLNPTDSATRLQFPTIARIYDTLEACFSVEPPGILADACTDAINGLGLAEDIRFAVTTIADQYGKWSSGVSPSATIIEEVLYVAWEDLVEKYELRALRGSSTPPSLTWDLRVSLILLIAEESRKIVLASVLQRADTLTDGDADEIKAELTALSVDWDELPPPPTAEEIEAWRNPVLVQEEQP